MNRKSFARLAFLALLSLAHCPEASLADSPGRRDSDAVYTMDNSSDGNHILAFDRAADGTLTPTGAFATGGLGTGGGLGNQGAVILSRNGRWLLACNAGSDDVSLFRVTPRGLHLADKVSSGGRRPISLALHGNLLYVLNAGGQAGAADNVTGFLFTHGRLWHYPGSTRPLSAPNTGPAQISFSPDGRVLVVTEKATSVIDTFTLDGDGLIDEHKQFASRGETPFGFAFRGQELLISEAFGGAAGASAVSSYTLDDDGELEVISPSVPTTETAACWVVVTRNGRFAYASNTGSGSISGYRVTRSGELILLDADGVTGTTGAGSGPIDMALSEDSRFLYVLNGGSNSISALAVAPDGGLSPLRGVSGLPAGANGLAAR
jgi:6-phosphogluconolactonase (cycloisomerase 2 family)